MNVQSINIRRAYIKKQYLNSTALIIGTALVCFFSVDLIGYRVVALILLLAVSVAAILFDILPVLLAALLSAVIWNFFFIPPVYNFHIGTTEDVLMFLMYFVVAMINAVLTFKIRQIEQKNREQHEKVKTIKLYNTLLNSLSHELRTPISAIIGSIDTIRENDTRLSDLNRLELLKEIEIAAFRLNRHVENLLSMGRLEAGILKPNPDWCDVNELIHMTIQNNQTLGRPIYFEPKEALPLFKTDGGFLELILQNLVHNAVQHNSHGTQIYIAADAVSDGIRIQVSDNGRGFPEREIPNVFDKFYRLSQPGTGGSGLGLSIVKGLTDALGGVVDLKNNIPGGAIFTILIPAAVAETNELTNE